MLTVCIVCSALVSLTGGPVILDRMPAVLIPPDFTAIELVPSEQVVAATSSIYRPGLVPGRNVEQDCGGYGVPYERPPPFPSPAVEPGFFFCLFRRF